MWAVDTRKLKLVGTIPIPAHPEFMVYDGRTRRLYVNIKGNNTIQVIDPVALKVVDSWSSAPAESPHGLAIDRATGRVFSAGSNGKLVVLDIATGKVMASVDIAPGVDQIAFDPSSRRVYCACHGEISVVQETSDGAQALGNIPSPPGSHTITVDPGTHDIWTCGFDQNNSFFERIVLK